MSHISENSECNASVDSIDFHDSGSRAGTTQEPHEDDNVTLPSKSRYGTSCTGCRRRKQRCDGKVPKCSRCRRLKEKCVYENNARNLSPPQSVPLLLQTFQFLYTLTDPTAGPPDFSIRPLIAQYLKDTPLPNFAGAQLDAPRRPSTEETVYGEKPDKIASDGEDEGRGASEVGELLMHMSLADDGQNGHFGVTSMYWESPSDAIVARLRHRTHRHDADPYSSTSPAMQVQDGPYTDDADRGVVDEDTGNDAGILKMNASLVQGWETLAFNKLELERGPGEAKMIMHLLDSYFCWQYAAHCVIYRPVFIRDMGLGGQYFSEFLLQVICACAVRYSEPAQFGSSKPSTIEAKYMSQAKALLTAEMDRPSSIPKIQGLLLLGQRDCAHGNVSQGWMYTGMAFRAIRDMGIHLDCSRLPIFGFGTLTVEDREIRRWLFWSAFTWDKIISLALGRTPTFNAHQSVSPGHIVDDTEDDATWQPRFSHHPGLPPAPNYPPHKSYITTNFRHFIKLCEIIQTIIMRLYVGRPRHVGIGRFIQAMRARLNEWFDGLPAEIKLDTSNLPEHCPPPHIFSTNVLYRASWILLYRIFIPNTLPAPTGAPVNLMHEASSTCTSMAAEIHELSKLCNKSFRLRNIAYMSIWSIYSAATINAIDFQSEDAQVTAAAGPRLSMSIYALERGIPQAPGTRRSIEIIKHRLRRPRSITKRTSFSFDDASVRDTTAARKLMRSSFESAHTHPMGAPAHTTAKSSPPIIPEIYGGSQTEAAPGSSAAATGAAVSDYQGQNWTYDLSSASTAKDTQSHPSPEADGWSTLYSLLTADDILYPAVEAGKQDGMHAWGGSPDLQSRRGMGGGLGQIDLSQGAMAMPSFINPQGTQKTWPEHFDDWN